MRSGESHQVSIRDLLMSRYLKPISNGGQHQVVLPEVMVGQSNDTFQQVDCFRG